MLDSHNYARTARGKDNTSAALHNSNLDQSLDN